MRARVYAVEHYKYLGKMPTNDKCIHKEVKSRLNSGNVSFHSVQNLLFSSVLFKNIKMKYVKL